MSALWTDGNSPPPAAGVLEPIRGGRIDARSPSFRERAGRSVSPSRSPRVALPGVRSLSPTRTKQAALKVMGSSGSGHLGGTFSSRGGLHRASGSTPTHDLDDDDDDDSKDSSKWLGSLESRVPFPRAMSESSATFFSNTITEVSTLDSHMMKAMHEARGGGRGGGESSDSEERSDKLRRRMYWMETAREATMQHE